MPPSIIIHLGHIVAVLRRSPASVASSSPSSRHRADEALPRHSAGSRVRGTSPSRTCADHGGAVLSVLDQLDREDVRLHQLRHLTLPLTVNEGTWTTLSPLIAMHLLDRSCMIVGIFLKLLRSPTVASEPDLCVDVICTSRTQRVVGDNSHTAYQHVIL